MQTNNYWLQMPMNRHLHLLLVLSVAMFYTNVHSQERLATRSNTDSVLLQRKMPGQLTPNTALPGTTQFTYMVTKTANNRFGYYILADGNMIFNQQTIPAIPGNKGFISQAEAVRTATLVISKLKNGEMPPTISVNDLKKLKIKL